MKLPASTSTFESPPPTRLLPPAMPNRTRCARREEAMTNDATTANTRTERGMDASRNSVEADSNGNRSDKAAAVNLLFGKPVKVSFSEEIDLPDAISQSDPS